MRIFIIALLVIVFWDKVPAGGLMQTGGELPKVLFGFWLALGILLAGIQDFREIRR